MKTVDKLIMLFQKMDEAKNPSEIEMLGIEVDKILAENAQQPIEGIASFLLERANILKQKVEIVANDPEVKYKGITYAFPEWTTIVNYCKLHSIKNPQTVSNWVSRGVISAQNVVIIKELNDLKLIRNLNYQGVL
jgi:hypothetical protein